MTQNRILPMENPFHSKWCLPTQRPESDNYIPNFYRQNQVGFIFFLFIMFMNFGGLLSLTFAVLLIYIFGIFLVYVCVEGCTGRHSFGGFRRHCQLRRRKRKRKRKRESNHHTTRRRKAKRRQPCWVEAIQSWGKGRGLTEWSFFRETQKQSRDLADI